jgi:hypothetical protein
MNLAPIAVSTYSRINHLKQTIEALQKNTLAEESELYIFSDAPKKGDEDIVRKVRRYADSVTGFKKVHVVKRKANGRVKNNRGGIERLLDSYGKCIFLEDDIVTAPGFLQFINDGLEFYKDDKNIISVGGHTPNLKANLDNEKDVYFARRFHPWGVGFWKDEYHKIKPISKAELNDKKTIKKINEYGTDLHGMMLEDAAGNINALDVRACFLMAKEDLYTVVPTVTLVKNIGLDGSGFHCGNLDIHEGDIISSKTKLNLVGFYYQDRLRQEYKIFYDRPVAIVRIFNKILRILLKRFK